MPTYEYRCPKCGHVQEEIHSIKASPKFICAPCQMGGGEANVMERMISANATGFVIKGGSSSAGWKEKRIRRKKNADMNVRQIDRYGDGPKLQPNVAGMEVSSWSDASKLAREAGMNTDSYKPLIEKEKHLSKSSNVDDRKWKKAKENKDKS